MANPSKVLSDALGLPVREDAAEAWIAELDRRSASVADGTAQPIDAAAAHAHVRETLRMRRAARK